MEYLKEINRKDCGCLSTFIANLIVGKMMTPFMFVDGSLRYRITEENYKGFLKGLQVAHSFLPDLDTGSFVDETVVIDKELTKSFKTKRGGYTSLTIEIVSNGNPRHWLKRCLGKKIKKSDLEKIKQDIERCNKGT